MADNKTLQTNCASCGGDPGGIVWEGWILPALLSARDITLMLAPIVQHTTVLGWFKSGKLRGCKLGKNWAIRSSRFVEDFAAMEATRPALREVVQSARTGQKIKPLALVREVKRGRRAVVDTEGRIAA